VLITYYVINKRFINLERCEEKKMRVYLKIFNPIIALLVFLLCIWAGMHNMDGEFIPLGIFKGSIATYFLAKGLFCGGALFILGFIALHFLEKDTKK